MYTKPRTPYEEKELRRISVGNRIIFGMIFVLFGGLFGWAKYVEYKELELRKNIAAQQVVEEQKLAEQKSKEMAAKVEKIMKTMVKCPAGDFIMGSPGGEKFHEIQHKVIISKHFYIGKYTVTQEQYESIMNSNPSRYRGANNPVECVSWNGALDFCNKLNEISDSIRPKGYKFSLPTEAQWEYACRAGATTTLNRDKDISCEVGACPNLDEVGWYSCNSNKRSHPVGMKKPNAWDIYDMHGNVFEWCSDWCGEYSTENCIDPVGPEKGYTRIARGGCWANDPKYCCSGYRGYATPFLVDGCVGFRLALVPDSQKIFKGGLPKSDHNLKNLNIK